MGLGQRRLRSVWDLSNRTPYAVGRNWVRDVDGMHHWLVAIRATFAIGEAGVLSLADEPCEPVLAPEYRGEQGLSSLRRDSDLLAIKPTTEVLVEAHAHAPRGRRATSVRATLRCGPVDKSLVAHGDRVYYEGPAGLSTTGVAPFETTPIVYERAFGGWNQDAPNPADQAMDERNPVGRGFGRKPAELANTPAHTLEPVDGRLSGGPAGFGPIDAGWLPRRKFAGTYDGAWVERRKPLLPEDYDARFSLSAPADQQTPAYLRGGETVGVVNMSHEGSLAFQLPILDLRLRTAFGRRRREDHGARLVTVELDLDARELHLVYQGSLAVVARDVDALDRTEVFEA